MIGGLGRTREPDAGARFLVSSPAGSAETSGYDATLNSIIHSQLGLCSPRDFGRLTMGRGARMEVRFGDRMDIIGLLVISFSVAKGTWLLPAVQFLTSRGNALSHSSSRITVET